MKLNLTRLKEELGLTVISDTPDRECTGCYAGDLLSWVMSHANEGDIWVTIMSNANVIAVASLVDTACIILSEGVTLDDDVASVAKEKGIAVYSTELGTYEVCDRISHIE